jgi:hypothetical protein
MEVALRIGVRFHVALGADDVASWQMDLGAWT